MYVKSNMSIRGYRRKTYNANVQVRARIGWGVGKDSKANGKGGEEIKD